MYKNVFLMLMKMCKYVSPLYLIPRFQLSSISAGAAEVFPKITLAVFQINSSSYKKLSISY